MIRSLKCDSLSDTTYKAMKPTYLCVVLNQSCANPINN